MVEYSASFQCTYIQRHFVHYSCNQHSFMMVTSHSSEGSEVFMAKAFVLNYVVQKVSPKAGFMGF